MAGVALQLGTSESSAKTYVRRAMDKLGAATRTEAVMMHARVHRACRRRDDTGPAALSSLR
jgi:DNA-binding NarL/FixJ family response regulator